MPEGALLKGMRDMQVADLSKKVATLHGQLRAAKDTISQLEQRILEIEKERDDALDQALYDPLTETLSRRGMMEQISSNLASLKRAERLKEEGKTSSTEVEEFSLLFFDLNGLKRVNDVFGHNAGDLYLKTFAMALRTQFKRETDRVCRWGGDEFVVLLGGVTPRAKAEAIASEFVTELSGVSLNVPFKNSPIGSVRHEVPLSAAVGVASTSDGVRTMEGLIEVADKAMYANKEATKMQR